MYTTLKNKEVKIKKPRQCWGCGNKFDIGKFMFYVVCVDDAELNTSYWCETCNAYFKTGIDCDYGVTQFEFRGESHYISFKKAYLCQERKVLFEKNSF